MKKIISKYKYRIAILGIAVVAALVTIIIGSTYGNNEINGIRYAITKDGYQVIDYNGDSEVVKIKTKFKGEYVTSIGSEAFFNNKEITKVILPQNLKIIEENAFANCIKLSEINLVDSIEVIEEGAFRNTLLYNLDLPKSMKVLNRGVLLTNNGVIEVPETIEEISESAFSNVIGLKEVKLPNTIRSIGSYAFYMCENLKKINLPDTIESIGKNAFNNTGIESIVLPKNLTVLEDSVFYGCNNLKEVILNEGLLEIKDNVFTWCDSLITINIPNTVIKLGYECFSYSGLIKVVIPNSVKEISSNIFCYCTSLKDLSLPFIGATSSNNKDIYYFFSGTKNSYNDPVALEIVRVTGDKVSIGKKAFAYSKTIKELHLETVISIGEEAFTSNEMISKIYLGKSLANAHEFTFHKGINVDSLELYCDFTKEYADQYFDENWCALYVNVHYKG